MLGGAPWVLGAILAAPAWVLLRITVSIVEASASLPFASVTLEAPLDVLTAIVAAGLIVGLHRRFRRTGPTRAAPSGSPAGAGGPDSDDRRRPIAIRAAGRWTRTVALGLAVTVLVAGAVVAARPAGVARITVLDVGQGDAILVEGSGGGRLLVDGGPDPTRLLIALDRRLPPWDRRIDAIVLSHPHEDHVAGLARLLERYRVRQVFEPGTRGPGPGLCGLAGAARPPERAGPASASSPGIDSRSTRSR